MRGFNSNLPTSKPASPRQMMLRRFFHQGWVEITIGVLVIISVMLTLLEFWLESELQKGTAIPSIFGTLGTGHLKTMMMINDIITYIFIVELTLRYFSASSKRAYFREFWLDIIATLPLFRVFRTGRALRLLRLVRLLRLLGVISRLSSHYPYIIRRGAVDFLMICMLLMLTIVFGTLAITHLESNVRPKQTNTGVSKLAPPSAPSTEIEAGDSVNSVNSANGTNSNLPDEGQFDLTDSFWFSIYTLFAGEPVPNAPRTLSGKIVSVFLMFMGLTIFAIFAGTVSAFMVDRMQVEGRIVEWDALMDHIVICGWTPKTKIIINEYRASRTTKKVPIVVITELDKHEFEDDLMGLANVYFVHDDFTRVSALERAGILNAKTCLVLTDTTGGRSEQDADARTILASLTVEKMNEAVYTCAELVNRSYATHLESGKVNDFVVTGEYGAHMLAQASMNRGLISVLSELMTYEHGNEFYRLPIPASWVGETFDQKSSDVRKTSQAILVAVHSVGEEPNVNPANYTFRTGDEIVLIGKGTPKLS